MVLEIADDGVGMTDEVVDGAADLDAACFLPAAGRARAIA